MTDRTNGISVLTQEKPSTEVFLTEIEKVYPKISNEHIILILLDLAELKPEDMLLFLPISVKHRALKKSFVIVANGVDLEEIPDELVVVPTIQEAYDMIEMESMERDLGF